MYTFSPKQKKNPIHAHKMDCSVLYNGEKDNVETGEALDTR